MSAALWFFEEGQNIPRRRHLATGALLVLLAVGLHLPALSGAFVYDDAKQIVGNHLIQEPGRLWQALTSDVWAFKGERDEAWSNYWRPTFTLWLAVSYRVFGLDSTVGWHAANLLLHALVTVLAYIFLLRLGLGWALAAATAAIFAVHPAHVESVVWISGSPDLLLAASLLAALILLLTPTAGPPLFRWTVMLSLYCVALGAKEIAILFPVLAGIVVAVHREEGSLRQRLSGGFLTALPFAVLAAGYFVLRWSILGRLEIQTAWRLSMLELVLTAPSILAFYLRQCLLPFWIGPSYPLRAVTAANLGLGNFWLPVTVCLLALGLAIRIVSRRKIALVGVAVFLLPLAPAFNINAFIQEQLTHDRYLYLPLLGFWLVLLVGLTALGEAAGRARTRAVAATMVFLVPFAIQTWRYDQAWMSEVALWEWGVRADPSSAFNLAQLGAALHQLDRDYEALEALDRALEIRPVTAALLTRAEIDGSQGRFERSRRDLELVLSSQPDNAVAYQLLAVTFQRQGRLGEAAEVLTRGRRNVPDKRCAFSSNLGVVLYLSGRKNEALQELESTRGLVGREGNTACKKTLFYLGSLYRETGQAAEAATAFRRFLEVTRGSGGQEVAQLRLQAEGLAASP